MQFIIGFICGFLIATYFYVILDVKVEHKERMDEAE